MEQKKETSDLNSENSSIEKKSTDQLVVNMSHVASLASSGEEKTKKKTIKLSEKNYEERFMEMLKKTAFGTKLREALEKMAQGDMGALIVLSEPSHIRKIMLGGFNINCKFTVERLVELSKMDGAIIVDPQLKKIHYANALLIPNPEILTQETGTRHQAAQRTAKQTGKLVIAVSQRTRLISLYSGNIKYTLKSIGTLVTRLQSVLDTLEEQKKIFNSLINYLNVLEFTNLVTAINVISVIQKAELIVRGKKMAKRYLTELGGESQLLELRLKEITKNVEENFYLLIKDYIKAKSFITIKKELFKLSYDSLLEFDNILKLFDFKSLDESLYSKGYRILSKIPALNQNYINLIIKKYGNLKDFMEANVEELKNMKGIGEKKAMLIKKELLKLRDSAMLSQSI